jgi:hypothetical protein
MPDNILTSIRTCLLNIDITARLRTKCQHYIYKEYPEVNKIIQEAQKSYFPDVAISKHIKKIMRLPRFSDSEVDEKARKTELYESYYRMFMYNLLLSIIQRMRLKLTCQKSDEYIDFNFELYSEFSKYTLYMFNHLGFEKSRINLLIQRIPDLWNLNEVKLDTIELKVFFTILDCLNQINSLSLPNIISSRLNEIVKSLEVCGLKDLVKKNHHKFDDLTDEYYLIFEHFVKFVDPDLISDLDLLITEVVHYN